MPASLHPRWFENLFGFAETDYASTQARVLERLEGRFVIGAAGRRLDTGRFEFARLSTLRQSLAQAGPPTGQPNRLSIRVGEAGSLHRRPELAGAVFQVASQFNMLEMTAPHRRPEDGITDYLHDPTQGPACAMAAAGGTLFRNYLVNVGEAMGQAPSTELGQREHRQLDGLLHLGESLDHALETSSGAEPGTAPWQMRNGYALFQPGQVEAIARHLRSLDQLALDDLRSQLAVGVQWDVDVVPADHRSPEHWPEHLPQVTQVYASALPVAYNSRALAQLADWQALAQLVLDAAYEATLLVAALHARRGGNPTVLLTFLGGGVFGNPQSWIQQAIARALHQLPPEGLSVELVSFGPPSVELKAFANAQQALLEARQR